MSSPLGPPPEAAYAEWDIKIRELVVLRRTQVTPGMLRVTLGGPGIEGFESHLPDEHCKLVFPDADTGVTRVPEQDGDHLHWPKPFPPTRDYTVRRYDAALGEVDFDFVAHDGGLAATWAQTAPVGSTIWVAGPRPSILVPPEFGFLVLLADETGLPAVGRWLEELPEDARGVAAVEVASPEEEQPLRTPAGFSLTWLHRSPGQRPGRSPLLGDFAASIALPTDTHTYVWAGGEAASIKPVRTWARAQGIGKRQSDISGYWRRGEDGGIPTGVLSRLRHRVQHEVEELLDR